MNSLTSKFSKLTLVILFLTGIASAQNINDALRLATPGLGANARALGMGNSYISLSDDASAAFFNPAGFGLLKRIEFSGGLSYQGAGNTTTFFNQSTNYDNSKTRLDRISFAFPFPTTRGSLVFGFSYHNTKDLTGALKFDGFNAANNSMIQDLNEATYYDNKNNPYNMMTDLHLADNNFNSPIAGRLQQSGTVLSEGGINNWTFSGAVEVYQNVFIGANLNIISGTYESNNEYYEDDANGLYQGQIDPNIAGSTDFRAFYLNKILNWDIGGWDAKVGFLYQLKNNARFGVTVQFPKSFNIEEKFDVSGYSQFANASYDLPSDYSDKVKYDITTPFEISAGFSYNYAGLILSAEGTLIDYSQTEFSGEGDGLSTAYINKINKDIKDQLTAVINYNVGLEYTIPTVGLRLRGGFIMQPSAYKDDASEFNRKYITAGIGILADETIGLDLGYAHGWWNDLGDNYGSNVSRTFQEVTMDKVIISATYRF